MSRKEKVELEADVARFVAPVEASAKAVDHLDGQVKDLDRDLNKLPADAAKAGAAMKLLGGDVDSVGKKVMSLGDRSTALAALDAKIRTSRSEVRKLADEFVKTGSVDVFKKLGDEQGNLLNLTTIRKKLAAELRMGFEDGAKTGASAFSAAFQGVPSEIKIALAAAIGGAALLLTPLLVSAVGGAVLAGVGGGVLATGIALAVRDPKIAGAFSDLGLHISRQFAEVVEPFKAEMIDVPDIFYASWAKILPQLESGVFAPLVGQVKPLAEGVGKFAENLMPGLTAAASAAAPIMAMISNNLPVLGKTISHFLEAISSDGAVQALQAVLFGIEFIIYATGDFIGALETVFSWFSKISLAAGSLFYDNLDQPKHFAEALWEVDAAGTSVASTTHLTTDQLRALNSQLSATAVTSDTLAGGMVDKLLDSMIRTRMGAINLQQAYDDLGDSMKRNGRNFDITTQAGRNNMRAMLGVIQANKEIYDTMIANNATTEEATAVWNKNTDALRAQLKAAGLSNDKINELIGTMGNVPNSVNSTIAIEHLTDAINNLNETIRLMNGLDGRVSTSTIIQKHVIQYFTETYGSMANAREGYRYARGGIRRAAAGMIIPPSDPGTVLVGEPPTGGEALVPLRGISQSDAISLLSVPAAAYGLEVSTRFRADTYQPTTATPSAAGGSAFDMRALGGELKRAMQGVGVFMDGQRVGYLQGLNADRQRRGG